MAFLETTRGVFGEVLLFMFTAEAVVAASLLDALDSQTPKESTAVGTIFTLIAGTLYAGRTYWDEKSGRDSQSRRR